MQEYTYVDSLYTSWSSCWWRHVAPRRFDLSSAKIVGRSMWAIGVGDQEARLSLALAMGCRINMVLFYRFLILFWIPDLCLDILSPKM